MAESEGMRSSGEGSLEWWRLLLLLLLTTPTAAAAAPRAAFTLRVTDRTHPCFGNGLGSFGNWPG